MANTVYDSGLSWLDLQKQLNPQGNGLLPVAEVLNQINAPLQDGPVTPSNALAGHRVTMQTALPVTSTLKLDAGVPRSKGTTEQRTESMGFFGAKSSIDRKNRKVWGAMYDTFRARQDRGFIESLTQKVALYFAYGEQSGAQDEAGFDGLAIRMPSLNQPAPGVNGSQVVSKGAVVGGDGTSIYIVDWNADMGAHWIYPQNDTAGGGLSVENHENVPVTDRDNNTFYGDETEYEWMIGLAVEDPRRISRLANIDTSDANLGGLNTQGNIINGLIDILSYMPSKLGFNRVLYVHARIEAAWWKQLVDKGAPQYISQQEYLGENTLHFAGCPIRRLDQLSLAESTVS